MIPAKQYARICIFINIMALVCMAMGRVDLGAVIMYAGLVQFQTYLIAKKYEERELEIDKHKKLR